MSKAGPQDVWHWTKPKYRTRAVVLLLVNAALFAGLGCFTFWLRTGQPTPFVTRRYWHFWWAAFDPMREQQITLIDFLRYPIPVDQVPMMMVIVGLVLASLTAVPILVSMLYRFGFSLIFVAVIAFVAVVPWLAITVTVCCYLARWGPVQFSFRYATALVSSLPLVVYYTLATRNAPAPLYLPTVEMARLYLPWVLALIAACAVMGVVLLIAKLVNYRPGAIAPLLAVMFAIPVAIFEAEVGRDELHYRLLEAEVGPGSETHFVDHLSAPAVEEVIRQAARERLRLNGNPEVTLENAIQQIRLAFQLRLAAGRPERDDVVRVLGDAFVSQRYQAIQACKDFRHRFPESRYVPNALYLEGRATDMRLARECSLFRGTLVLNHYQRFPRVASRPAWEQLHDRFWESPLASVATYRLAILEARQGKVDHAVELLNELIGRPEDQDEGSVPARGSGWRELLAKQPPSSSLDVDPAAVVQEGRKLIQLLNNNRDPEQNDLALQRLLRLDPCHPMYRRNLERLRADIARGDLLTGLGDNVEVLLAAIDPSRTLKIKRLTAIIQRLADGTDSDALPRARFELGRAYQEDNLPAKARAAFEELTRLHPDSPWVLEAKRRLADMGVTGGPDG